MEFRRIAIEDRKLIISCLKPENIGWEYDFSTLFVWNSLGQMQIAENDGWYCVYNIFSDRPVFMPPYLTEKADFLTAIKEMYGYATAHFDKFVIRGLTKEQAEILSANGYRLKTNRNDYDYVYKADDLRYLKGKTYHSKRNFVTRFIKSYDFKLCEYTSDDFNGVMELYDAWTEKGDHELSIKERDALVVALNKKEELDLKIALIKVDERVIAFSVASIQPNGVAHGIFEKADISFVGAYQAINKLLAEKYFMDGMLVNRQEDMGVEGLRKAKLSYSPYILLEKFYLEG